MHVANTRIAAVLDVLLAGTVLRRGAAAATEVEAATADARAAAVEAATPVEAGRLALAGLEARIAAEGCPLWRPASPKPRPWRRPHATLEA